ncbi:MAG: phosphodiester glycosidase family protein [Candidatus Eremiobacteraeota bacterium]|nr:phosphodiester glycosidase family protein [Candidatus Eremiobacteraeota bacterium]
MSAALLAALLAPALPAALGGPAPFPAVVAQAQPDPQFVAPGISRADYALRTADGPLVVHVVAVDPHAPSVRVGAVLAHDRLVSPGETVSSMANRTGAVAGINADYFDIGATNQPLNVVVTNGALLRSPSTRAALWVGRDRSIGIGALHFDGDVRWETTTLPLTAIDVWPPEAGASLVLPAHGPLSNAPGVTTVPLTPVDPALGTYRVADTAASGGMVLGGTMPGGTTPGGPLLALGPAALAQTTPPPPGTTVVVRATLDPALDGIAAAVGGGPQLVRDGAPYADPNAPAPDETNRRFPLAGAALRTDGTLLLVVVDGRRPEDSIGLTRPQFGALFLGLGARDATAFDSGGSSTLVARVLGDANASVLNVPSDGEERPVADGLFVYSDAPRGTPDRLALRPDRVRALPGAHVRIEARIVDAVGHAFGTAPPLQGAGAAGRVHDGVFTVEVSDHTRDGASLAGAAVRHGEVPVRSGALRAVLPVDVIPSIHTLRLVPANPNPDPGEADALCAVGEDANGNVVETVGAVRFTVQNGTISDEGIFRAGAHDGVVLARAGGASARLVVPVGRHLLPLTPFADPARWNYVTAPANAPGRIAVANGTLALNYDLTGTTRAAYAQTMQPLPGEPVALDLDVLGDASGVGLRARFTNRYGEPIALTLARRVDWSGWKRLHIAVPGTLNPPIVLTALYVVPSLGGPPVHTAGTLQFKGVGLVEPGTP